MGWTWQNAVHIYPSGEINRKAECDALVSSSLEILKSQMAGSTYYAAVRPTDGYNVFCVVILTKTEKHSYNDFGYKDMTEFDFPSSVNCPNSILDMLTPTCDSDAIKWRELCRENNEKSKVDKDMAKTLRDLPIGSKILWTTNIDLSNMKQGASIILTKAQLNGLKNPSWHGGGYRYPQTLLKHGTITLPEYFDSYTFNGTELVVGKTYAVKMYDIPSKNKFQIEKIYKLGSMHKVNGKETLFPTIAGNYLLDNDYKSAHDFDIGDWFEKPDDLVFEEV